MKPTRIRAPFGLFSTIVGLVAASMLMPEGCAIDAAQSAHLRQGVPLVTPLVFLLLSQLLRRRGMAAILALTVCAEVMWLAIVAYIYAPSFAGLRESFGPGIMVFSVELIGFFCVLPLIAWSARRELAAGLDDATRATRRATTWAITSLAAAACMLVRFGLIAEGTRSFKVVDPRLAFGAYLVFAVLAVIALRAVLATQRTGRAWVVGGSVLPGVTSPDLAPPRRDALVAKLCLALAAALTIAGLSTLRQLPTTMPPTTPAPSLHLGC